GVYFYSPRKDFVFHIGGAVHYDAAFYGAGRAIQFNPGGGGELNDGVALRRGRLRADGTFYKNLDFLLEMEFSNGFVPSGLPVPAVPGEVSNSPGPTDANLTFRNVPVLGNVRVGSQKEPFSLEHLNSYRFLEFMERSYLFDVAQPTAFNNGFTP